LRDRIPPTNRKIEDWGLAGRTFSSRLACCPHWPRQVGEFAAVQVRRVALGLAITGPLVGLSWIAAAAVNALDAERAERVARIGMHIGSPERPLSLC
jgi:hypothetical protein